MKELPGDVFIGGQIDIVTLTALAEQGIMSFVNNRPDNEGHMQPSSESLEAAAKELGVDYQHIPMAGGFTEHMITRSIEAYAQMPRPIMAFCASGMRSAALWGFANVNSLGVDQVMAAISGAGYNLEQLRAPLTEFHAQATSSPDEA